MLTSNQLKAGIHSLASDIVDASIHWKMVLGIEEAAAKWPLVTRQSNTFWVYTLKAHLNTSVLALCRAFDQEQKSLHLVGLLQLIQRSLSLFDDENFRERLRGNPFVESLAESASRPDASQLSADMSRCSEHDPLVKRLVKHRNNSVAHSSRKRRINGVLGPVDEEITYEDYQALLNRAVEILNRYSGLFSAEYFSTQVIGHKDYETVFRWVQEGVEADEARVEAEVKRLSG